MSHKFTTKGGRYECVDCDYTTLNVWCAKSHYADKNGIDYEITDEFRS